MDCKLDDLRAFLAIADTGSFRAGADALSLSQSALSRRIDKLEAGLGIRLLDRTTRRVELTTLGRGFVPKARNVLHELERALLGIRDVAERLSGEVTFACVPSAVAHFLPPVIARYHAELPGIRLRVLDESSIDIVATVARGEADFGITYIGTGDPDIAFEPLLEEPFVVACPADHPLARRRRVRWAELGGHDVIALAPGTGNRLLIDVALAGQLQRPRWFCEVNHVTALLSFVEAGLGVGVVPRMALPQAGPHAVRGVPLVEPAVTRTLGVVSRRGKVLSPASERFRAWVLGRG